MGVKFRENFYSRVLNFVIIIAKIAKLSTNKVYRSQSPALPLWRLSAFKTAVFYSVLSCASGVTDNLLVGLSLLTAREGLVIPHLHFDQFHREFLPYPDGKEPQSNKVTVNKHFIKLQTKGMIENGNSFIS